MQKNNDVMNEITEIKAQLCRQRKLLRLSLIGWIGSASVLILSSVPGLQDLRVRRLALVDSKGVERVILSADNIQPNFNGKPWVRDNGAPIYRRSPVSGLILQDKNGTEVGGIGSSEDGMVALALDGYSKYLPLGAGDRVGIFSAPDGTAGFLLNDLKGNTRTTITSGPDLSAELSIFSGRDDQPRIHGKVSLDGTVEWKP